MATLFVIWHAQHIAQSSLVQADCMAPLDKQRCDNLYVDVEDVLALVGGEFDQVIHHFAAERSLLGLVDSWYKVLTPLDQQGRQVSHEVVETDAACVLLDDKVADRSEPVLSKGLEKLTVIHQKLEYEDLDILVAIWLLDSFQ